MPCDEGGVDSVRFGFSYVNASVVCCVVHAGVREFMEMVCVLEQHLCLAGNGTRCVDVMGDCRCSRW